MSNCERTRLNRRPRHLSREQYGHALPAPQLSSAGETDTSGDEDDPNPICLAWPLTKEWYRKQCRERRHQGSKGGTTGSAKDGNRTTVQKKGDNGHEYALENRLNRNLGERPLRKAGSATCEVNRKVNHQRSGGDKSYRVKWIKFRLPHGYGEACR